MIIAVCILVRFAHLPLRLLCAYQTIAWSSALRTQPVAATTNQANQTDATHNSDEQELCSVTTSCMQTGCPYLSATWFDEPWV